MADFIKVATSADVPPGEVIAVEYQGEPVALANINGEYLAIGGRCTHRGGPLGEGELEADTVVCPWHGGIFNLRTGQVEGPPPATNVPVYRVLVDGDEIEIAPA